MIKVSVMYPNASDVKFDIDYYCNTHLAIVEECLGDALKGGNVDYGIGGGQPGELAPFIAIGHLIFDSVAEFEQSFGPHAEKIMGDLPNFTNAQPQIQISEIKV
ncbi:EthD family reductase [Alteromonas sp. C1M14]|uniref:EthD family reductase n=1 Tax=Alteromonas sp. C1M14 TaxID=2841567 RepID=UPI001C0A0EB2|nr:EthD family reductase [Alteromonas sp. C1M14]MBU2978731.1 EthD family reductase [Alteromonas sp. C1M14]